MSKFSAVTVEIEIEEGDQTGTDTLSVKVAGESKHPSDPAFEGLTTLASVAALWPVGEVSTRLPWRIASGISKAVCEEIANAEEIASTDAEIAALVASDPDAEIADLVAVGLESAA